MPSLANINAQEKTAIAAEDGDFSRLQPYLKDLSRSQRIMFILEQMMAAQRDKNSLTTAFDLIKTAREQLNFSLSQKEALEALATYKSRHPERHYADSSQHTEVQTIAPTVPFEQKSTTCEQHNPIACKIEFADFRITLEGHMEDGLEQLLSNVLTTLRATR